MTITTQRINRSKTCRFIRFGRQAEWAKTSVEVEVMVVSHCVLFDVAHDDDVRSTRPCGGVSGHGEPVWNGLPGAEHSWPGSVHRQLADSDLRQRLSVQGQATTAL